MAHDFTLSVNAIIVKDNKVLLVKRRDRDMWRIPGGEVSLGETIDEAMVRLIRSKLGLAIAIRRVTGLYSKPIQNELVVVFEAELIDEREEPNLSYNYQEYNYFALDELPEKLPDKNEERLRDFKINAKNPVVKTQMSAPSSLKFPKINI